MPDSSPEGLCGVCSKRCPPPGRAPGWKGITVGGRRHLACSEEHWSQMCDEIPTLREALGIDRRYFIATRKHGFVGNDVLFWRPESAGYTTNLDDAGRYDEAEATKIVNDAPAGECRMLPVDDVTPRARRVLDGQDMHRLGGWEIEEVTSA